MTASSPVYGWHGQTGAYLDGESGLLKMGARYYAPCIGRFLSRDPSGFAAGTNLYSFCLDDPIDFFDPNGCEGIDLNSALWQGIGLADGMDKQLGKLHLPGLMPSGIPGALVGAHNSFRDWGTATGDTKVSADDTWNAGKWAGANFANATFAVAGPVIAGMRALGAAEEAARAASRIGCFVAGTEVQMADGSHKPIEEVQAGDEVVSRDERAGKTTLLPATVTTAATSGSRQGEEVRLDLDLSRGENTCVETRILPASQVVQLVNGTSRPAGQLRPGDQVRMRGSRVGVVQHNVSVRSAHACELHGLEGEQNVRHRVLATIRRQVDTTLWLSTDTERLTTTPEHPFFVHGKGWVAAVRLHAGDALETLSGKLIQVKGVEAHPEKQVVYNFEVEGVHNYFVGKDRLLVHNMGEDCIPEIARTIGIVERDGDVVRIIGTGPKGDIEVVANMRREGSTIIFSKAHIDGPGAGQMGIRELGEFARQFGRQEDAGEIIIEGAKRTTGARPGHIPRPFKFKIY